MAQVYLTQDTQDTLCHKTAVETNCSLYKIVSCLAMWGTVSVCICVTMIALHFYGHSILNALWWIWMWMAYLLSTRN